MTRTGVDIVEVDRIKRLHAQYGNHFLQRVFTKREIEYSFQAKTNTRYQRLATRFAAKEAVIKAIGHAVPFSAIEVNNETSGRPAIICNLTKGRIEASLSHTDKLAIAFVLIEDT
jgi:holo-[acyl-carrier protein] synthase